MAAGVGRFQVMATLQAARAHVLGLPIRTAKSWGLNRAIFYAAAKRGFKGGGPPATVATKTKTGRTRTVTPDEFHLGEDKAYAVRVGAATLFTIGGEVQAPEDFHRQIEARFAGTFRAAWEQAVRIVRGYTPGVLASPLTFYDQVYRPRRDELARAWNERAQATTAPPPPGKRAKSARTRTG